MQHVAPVCQRQLSYLLYMNPSLCHMRNDCMCVAETGCSHHGSMLWRQDWSEQVIQTMNDEEIDKYANRPQGDTAIDKSMPITADQQHLSQDQEESINLTANHAQPSYTLLDDVDLAVTESDRPEPEQVTTVCPVSKKLALFLPTVTDAGIKQDQNKLPVDASTVSDEVDHRPVVITGGTDSQQKQEDIDLFVEAPAAKAILAVSIDPESALLPAPAGMGQVEGLDEQLSNPSTSARSSTSDDDDTSDIDFVPDPYSSDSDLSEVLSIGLLHREQEQPSEPEKPDDDDTLDVDFVPGTNSSYPDLSEVIPTGLLHRQQEEPSKPDKPDVSTTKCQKVMKKMKKKIPRPCLFCGSRQTNLHRHIVTRHKKEERVVAAMKLPYKDRCMAFAKMRKEGILKHNKSQMKLQHAAYEKERQRTEGSCLVMCSTCSGFYSRTYFARHKKLCIGDSAHDPRSLPINFLSGDKDDAAKQRFKADILAKFSQDTVGDICRSDAAIIMYGSRMYDKMLAKKDKATEVKKSVMSDMRRLSTLYQAFKKVQQTSSSEDMLVRRNFHSLTTAIEETTTSDSEVKAGLKTALYYLLQKFAKVLKGSYLIKDEDSRAEEIDKFLQVLALNHNLIFGDAAYILNKNRQMKLRCPESLPSEDDVAKLKKYTVGRLHDILAQPYTLWDSHAYTELRDLTVSRLTLFNARRGGEPARLSLAEWKQAEENRWLNHDRIKSVGDWERTLFNNMKITFQTGKGNHHLVPILIPDDVVAAMRKLSESEVRSMSNVSQHNAYMFPSTQSSDSHVSGWHAVNRVCCDAQVEHPERLTATKMRHRISTLYAALDVSENERQLFYKHMGHSGNINQNIYQTPLAEAEILKVGTQLQLMDGHYAAASASGVGTLGSEQQESGEDEQPPGTGDNGACKHNVRRSKKRHRGM